MSSNTKCLFLWFIYVGVCGYPYIEFIQGEAKKIKAFGAVERTLFMGVDEIVEWSKALNERCFPRIESAKFSFHLINQD